MAAFSAKNALILIDFINEIVDPKGKFAGKGYADFDTRHATLDRVRSLLQYVRGKGHAVIHVRLGFSSDYKEQPEGSLLFGGAKKAGAVKVGEWSTEFHPKAAPLANEATLTKHRVNAFFGTPLDTILRTYGVKNLVVVGCATDMAVQTAVRDAHDRDYACTVLSDCCVAASDEDHEQTLRLLAKVATIMDLEQFQAM